MANLLQKTIQRSSFPTLSLDDYVSFFNFNGLQYPFGFQQTLGGNKEEIADFSFEGLSVSAYKTNGIIFACMLARQLPFSEARFAWRQRTNGRPGNLFGTTGLAPLERPWPGGVTADLLSRAIQDVDLAGNFFATRRGDRIRRLRPDWVTILLGSFSDPSIQAGDIDAEVVGYIYHPGGRLSSRKPEVLLREQVAHFAPIPDPTASFRGMSWLIPVIREFMSDSAMMVHKSKFFENGATPNMVVTLDPSIKKEAFKEWVSMFSEKHEGALNAYKTLYLGAGSTVMPVGKDFKQMDFAVTQAAGESRIAAASGVPSMLVGLSEGMRSATYANYSQARRRFADMTLRPLWRSFATSMEILLPVPAGAELWYDDRDIPFLVEDLKDRAEVQNHEAQSIRQMIDAGWEPDSVRDAIIAQDWSLLKHTGLFSVQLWAPGQNPAQANQNAGTTGSGDNHPAKKTADEAPTPAPAEKKSRDAGEMLLDAAVAFARMRDDGRAVEAPKQGDVHVHMAEGMVRSDVHVDATTTVESGAVQVDAPVTIEDGAIRAEAPQVHVDANTTFEEGSIRGGDIDVAPAELVLQDGAIKVVTEIREGAVRVDAPVTVEGHTLELRDGAIHVVTEIQEGAVRVDSPVTIERGAVEIDAPVTVERTEVHVDEGAVQVSAPVTVERTEVHVDPGAVQVSSPVTVERTEVHLDPGSVTVPVTIERSDVEVHVDEGAVQVSAPITVERSDVHVDPGAVQVSVERTEVHIDEGAVRVDAGTTFEEGAIRGGDVTVEPADVRVEAPITVERSDVEVRIEEGAVKVDARTEISEGAVRVDAPVSIEPGAVEVRVDAPVTLEKGAVQVDSPVTIERGAVEVEVQPPSVDVTVEAPEAKRGRVVRETEFRTDDEGKIVGKREVETDE